MCPDVIGRPWEEAENMLREAGVRYGTVMARPTRHFFVTDERKLYVIRAKSRPDGMLQLVLAARLASAVKGGVIDGI